MTGRKSPWGGGNGDEPKDDAPASPEDEGAGLTPGVDKAGGSDGPPADPPKGPRNPWASPESESPPRRSAKMEDILRQRLPKGGGGGGFGGFPKMPERANGRSWAGPLIGIVALLWIGVSTTHVLGSNEEGIVTTLGKYNRSVGSGMSFTAPWPIEKMSVEDVTSIKRDTIPEGEAEKLMLTSDQNLVDISYLVRWNIKDLKLYTFQLDDPQDTVKEVAEAAMRAAVAGAPLKDVMGASRGQIELSVRQRMQAILDAYHSGVLIQGVDIKKTDAPEKVVEAFQKVTAAQQNAQQQITAAKQWAQQVINQSQGNAAEFNKVYEQYKLAPEVTRRRLYYETMERVLSNNDKVIVEANGVTPYLPLPEIKRRAALVPPAGGQ
ncbi:MAG: SPFH domain-containing protein [Novosphingobium sp.]